MQPLPLSLPPHFILGRNSSVSPHPAPNCCLADPLSSTQGLADAVSLYCRALSQGSPCSPLLGTRSERHMAGVPTCCRSLPQPHLQDLASQPVSPTLRVPIVSAAARTGPACSRRPLNARYVNTGLPVAVQGCEHHVRGVQRVDEVGGEAVLLLQYVGLPVCACVGVG